MAKPAISRFALSAARYAKGSPTRGAGERSETERFNLLYLRNQRRVNLFQIQLEQFRHAVFLHGHTVQDIGGLHGAAAVGDDDELGLVAHPAQILRKAADIGIIQGGFDLVQDTERCRVDGQDRKIDADGHQRLLAAGKASRFLMTLPGGAT